MPNMSLHNAHPTTEYKPLVKKEKRKHDATESAQLQPLSHSLMQKKNNLNEGILTRATDDPLLGENTAIAAGAGAGVIVFTAGELVTT